MKVYILVNGEVEEIKLVFMVDAELFQQKFLRIFVWNILNHYSGSAISLDILEVNHIGPTFLDGDSPSIAHWPVPPSRFVVASLNLARSMFE